MNKDEIGILNIKMKIKVMQQSDIMKCPSYILLPEHYRDDGSCKHDEPNCELEDLGERCQNLKYKNEIFCRSHLEFYEEFDG